MIESGRSEDLIAREKSHGAAPRLADAAQSAEPGPSRVGISAWAGRQGRPPPLIAGGRPVV